MSFVNIAIDGHSASGKSTICDLLAKKLKINHLSSGAIYRAIALYFIENNLWLNFLDKKQNDNIKKSLENVKIEVKFDNFIQKIILNNVDVTDKLNTDEISTLSSIVSQNLIIREFVKDIQLNLANNQDIIIDGRDITSEVLKSAKNKFFVTASLDERAKRRFIQYNNNLSFEEIKENLRERDERDEKREICPLKIVEDAIIIDSTNLTIDETVEKILKNLK